MLLPFAHHISLCGQAERCVALCCCCKNHMMSSAIAGVSSNKSVFDRQTCQCPVSAQYCSLVHITFICRRICKPTEIGYWVSLQINNKFFGPDILPDKSTCCNCVNVIMTQVQFPKADKIFNEKVCNVCELVVVKSQIP